MLLQLSMVRLITISAGNAQPKLQLGWNNAFRYKNLDLSHSFSRSTLGNKIYNQTKSRVVQAISTVATYNIPVAAFNESINRPVIANFNC